MKMYFEELKKKITTMIEEKVRKEKEHDDQVKECESTLEDLKKSKNEALNQGDDESFVKLGGLIAVNEAKLNRVREEIAVIVTPETISNMMNEINDEYHREVGKRINDVFKMCDKMLKEVEEIAEIFDGYSESVYMVERLNGGKSIEKGWIDRDVAIHHDNGDITSMLDYMRSVIDPYCENGNGRSIRGYAFRLNYDPKK